MIPRHDHAAALLVLFALSPCSRVDRICIVCYVNLTTSMSLLGNALMKANQPIFKFRPSFQVRIDILCSFPVHVVEGHDRLWRKSKEEISASVARAAASTFLRSVDEITCKKSRFAATRWAVMINVRVRYVSWAWQAMAIALLSPDFCALIFTFRRNWMVFKLLLHHLHRLLRIRY